MFDPNQPLPDFESQQQQMSMQQALAVALRKKALGAQAPEGQMVSGHYVAPHWTQQLAPLIDQINAHWSEANLAKSQRKFGEQVNQARDQWQQGLPPITPAEPGHPELQGPRDEGGSPELDAIAPKPAQLPDRATILGRAIAGSRIPGNEGAAAMWAKGMGEEITREDTQAARKEDRDLQRQLSRENFAATLAQRAAEAEQRSKDTQLSIEQRREAAELAAEARRMHSQVLREIAQMKGDKTTEKNLPAAQATAWIKNNSSMKFIDQALDAVDAYPAAFGIKNALGNAIRSRTDPKGVDARALVANIGSLRIHERSGAAVTAAESPRLKPFIPVMDGPAPDNAETVRKKLILFAREYANIQQEILDFAAMQNYKNPGDIYQLRDRTKGNSSAPVGATPPPGLKLPPGATYIGPAQ